MWSTTLSANVSVSDVRAWFAASPHRRMALLADDGRYAGSVTLRDLDGDGDPLAPAAQYAQQGPTVTPEASADRAPHGDRLLQLRRQVPSVTIIIDTPEAIARSFQIVDEVTAGAGLVTSEMVPASATLADSRRTRGGLRLARHRF